LRGAWEVQVAGPREIETPFSFRRCDFNDDDSLSATLEGIEAVIHVAQPSPDVRGTDLIDYRTRQTYNLLRAATAMGVSRGVYLSSLAIMLGYDERFMITEDFRPRPRPDAQSLSHYLGETTCREFARASELEMTVVRLGRLDNADDASPEINELPRTTFRDAAQAVAAAIGGGVRGNRPKFGSWSIQHIHSESDATRFPLTKAERLLNYRPLPKEDDG
jgi:nucleoside-diphosphate-sugar epimerase